MRKRLSVFIFAMLLSGLWVGEVSAQRKPIFFINSGIAAPASNTLSDFWNAGFNLGVGVEYFFNPNLAVQGTVNYNRFGLNEGRFLAQNDALGVGTASGGTKTLFTGFANLKFSKTIVSDDEDTRALPYVVGGVGLMRTSQAGITVVEITGATYNLSSDTKAAFAINAGGGVDIRMTDRVHLFLEGRFEVGFTSGGSTQLFPARVGISFE